MDTDTIEGQVDDGDVLDEGVDQLAEMLKVQAAPDLPDLRKRRRCEAGTGEGHEIVHWEVVSRFHYGMDGDGDATDIDVESDVLWADCSCGHEPYF